MPEMYLRGAIFNKTMKNLTQDQMDEVEKYIEIFMNTKSLNKSRKKFIETLQKTIGADYKDDRETAIQEYKIALMKVIIYVLYHKPNRQIFDDPVQTRKMVSQFTYNYMKQILNENKIPKSSTETIIEDEPYIVACDQIINILESNSIKCEKSITEKCSSIYGDIGIINLKTAKRIGRIKERFNKMGVNITANEKQIQIDKIKSHQRISIKIKKDTKIHVINVNHKENENDETKYQDIVEYKINKYKEKEKEKLDLKHMESNLPKHLKEVFNIIINHEGNKEPNRTEIAKVLNITTNEVIKRLNQMKYYCYNAMEIN